MEINEQVNALVIQSDGKIVAAGQVYYVQAKTFDSALARYDISGALDPSFGKSGILIDDLGGMDLPNALAIQADGKFIIAGQSNAYPSRDAVLARYNADGSPDTSFGTSGNGRIVADFGKDEWINGLAIQKDGKIVAVGKMWPYSLVRYTPDGKLDPSFGDNGKSGQDHASDTDIAILPDGKIITIGTIKDQNDNSNFSVLRFNTNGAFEAEISIDFTKNDSASALLIQPDGKILVAGSTGIDLQKDFALARFYVDGSIDRNFGTGGKVVSDFGGSENAVAIALQADGKIVVAGDTPNDQSDSRTIVARYNPDGTLDTNFGASGKEIYDFMSFPSSVQIQSDGKIVVAGDELHRANFALARILPDVSPGICGNGIKEVGETCDDGNTADGDGCSSTCITESSTPVSTSSEPSEEAPPSGGCSLVPTEIRTEK